MNTSRRGHSGPPLSTRGTGATLAITAFLAILATPLTASSQARSEAARVGATPSGNYLAARHARTVSNASDAADFLLAALKVAPDDPMLLNRAVTALIVAGRVSEAVPIACRASASDPLANLPVLVLATDEIRAGRYHEAAARLGAMPKGATAAFVAPMLAAWALYGAGDADAALAKLATVADKPHISFLYRLHSAWMNDAAGRGDVALGYLDEVLRQQQEPWLRLVDLAAALNERAGRRDEAKSLLRAYAVSHPDTKMFAATLARIEKGGAPPPADVRTAVQGAAEVLFDAAGITVRQNNREMALMLAQLGLSLRPNFPPLQIVLGDLLEDFDRLEDANRVYAAIDRSSPLSWAARLSTARNLERLERFDAAAELLRNLAKERPDDPDPLAELGDMLRKRDRFRDAVVAYDEALGRIPSIEPQHWRILYVRGIALERSKDWPRAEADFLKALELEPDQPYVLNYLGYSWVEQGKNLEQAEEMIRRAVELRPQDGYIVDSLGWVLFRLGRNAEAVEHMERAVELKPEDPVINDHLGDVYWAVGRKREARYQWRAALALKPEADLIPKIEAKLQYGPAADADAAAVAQ